MDQLIVTIISMKKGSCNWFLNETRVPNGSSGCWITNPRVAQHKEEKGQAKNKWSKFLPQLNDKVHNERGKWKRSWRTAAWQTCWTVIYLFFTKEKSLACLCWRRSHSKYPARRSKKTHCWLWPQPFLSKQVAVFEYHATKKEHFLVLAGGILWISNLPNKFDPGNIQSVKKVMKIL